MLRPSIKIAKPFVATNAVVQVLRSRPSFSGEKEASAMAHCRSRQAFASWRFARGLRSDGGVATPPRAGRFPHLETPLQSFQGGHKVRGEERKKGERERESERRQSACTDGVLGSLLHHAEAVQHENSPQKSVMQVFPCTSPDRPLCIQQDGIIHACQEAARQRRTADSVKLQVAFCFGHRLTIAWALWSDVPPEALHLYRTSRQGPARSVHSEAPAPSKTCWIRSSRVPQHPPLCDFAQLACSYT